MGYTAYRIIHGKLTTLRELALECARHLRHYDQELHDSLVATLPDAQVKVVEAAVELERWQNMSPKEADRLAAQRRSEIARINDCIPHQYDENRAPHRLLLDKVMEWDGPEDLKEMMASELNEAIANQVPTSPTTRISDAHTVDGETYRVSMIADTTKKIAAFANLAAQQARDVHELRENIARLNASLPPE